MPHLLSKSKYIRGLQCDRALWLDVHRPSLAHYTADQMRRFDRGRDFEHTFKDTFPDGIDLSAELKRNVDAYPGRTAQLLDHGDGVVLFEAGFQYDDVLVLADVVCQREDGSLDIYEVKSGTTLSETYKRDAALQHYVISRCRPVHSFSVVHASYAADGPFGIVDLTVELAAAANTIACNVARMKSVALSTAEPATPTGRHCLEPYACPYRDYCRQGVRQLSIF
ncbi:MAG: hypothetical protein AUK63_893 [bacterium P3]|nr:MAG: hypothetical protein AUK64_1050 [bacterium P201]KWW30447.1 MAG: hypothetical protein AUK63_893 [bacterium P3]KWW41334.1 MAG: hypothetical protein F083_1081 [bacterium F083]